MKLARAQALLQVFESGMLQNAHVALEVAERAYLAGAISLLETLEAQRTYIETQAQYLATRYEHRQALLDMAYATGVSAL